ncbi:hypothetical protein [Paenibacillus odorifer]|uniref:hypothetical protein n=3 Tax=Paenibacillus TaxID=44249 RepID=UPI0015C3B279|nr:hypothetical protein [Paenibacillus odorifer]
MAYLIRWAMPHAHRYADQGMILNYATSPNIRIITRRRIVDLYSHGSAPYGVLLKTP